MTKYLVNQSTIDKIVFKYLDLNLKGLEKRKAKYFEGIVFGYPNEEFGLFGLDNNGTLFIYHGRFELIDKICSFFGLNHSDSKSIIGRWFSDRFQLEVINIQIKGNIKHFMSDRHL